MAEEPKTEKDALTSILFFPFGFGGMGVATAFFANHNARRPLYSGIHRHFLYGLTGVLVGYYFDLYLKKKYAYRDAVIKHYVELHPEDFIEPERRKYKEMFEVWKPIR